MHMNTTVCTFASPWTACMNVSLFGNAGRDAYFGQHLMKMSFEDVFGLKINPMNGSTAYKTLRNVLQTKNSSISNLR
jgi:hypothetical protein